MQLLDHLGDGAAATGAGKPANENVITRGTQFDTHFECAQCAFLANETFARFGLRGSFKGNAREIAAPAQLALRQLGV